MARKKKATKKGSSKSKKGSKADSESAALPEGFWNQVVVILVIILALLLFLGSLGTGGAVPVQIFVATRWTVGYFAYLIPLVLVLAAVKKHRDITHKLPRSILFGIILMVISIAGFMHLFVAYGESLDAADAGNGGGMVGHITSSAILTVLNKFTGGIILVATFLISLHFVLRIPLTRMLGFLNVREKDRDGNSGLKVNDNSSRKDSDDGFKLNEGVPIQKSRLANLKNSAERLSPTESHEALTTSSDANWEFPGLDLLNKKQDSADAGDVEGNAQTIKNALADFNINVEMRGANIGPRVTQYTLAPPAGVKLTKITALENNLALNLAATSIRMEAPIPGQRAVGIEVPNIKAASVRLHGILSSNEWAGCSSPLGFAIGKDIAGKAVVGELDAMPHLLIAGATGSGKSVMINTLLSSLLYRNSPADMKLILVDPKQVELTPYQDIPHLLTPVITEPERCISALKWAVAEMERRYSALAEIGKRNIAEYNRQKKEEGMPYIIVVIDELADLMMLAARDVEALIVRLAQKARAVGIHLVLATQRPSVDVITGLIKANIPARIAFTVASQVDSRTIIDQGGADKLLGRGDMLYLTPSFPKPVRIQGAFIDDKEIEKITHFIKNERAPEYDDEIISQPVQLGNGKGSSVPSEGGGFDDEDSLYMDAVQVVVDSNKASASLLQRRLRVGYSRAARLIESMEEHGIIGPADGARPREVLISSMDELSSGGQGGDAEFEEA